MKKFNVQKAAICIDIVGFIVAVLLFIIEHGNIMAFNCAVLWITMLFKDIMLKNKL